MEDTDFHELGRQLLTEFGSMHHRISRSSDKALGKGWVEREHSKTDRRRVHVTMTDKGFQNLEIKRREFEERTAAFLEQLGETDTQEMVRLLRRLNEIIDCNQERRNAK